MNLNLDLGDMITISSVIISASWGYVKQKALNEARHLMVMNEINIIKEHLKVSNGRTTQLEANKVEHLKEFHTR